MHRLGGQTGVLLPGSQGFLRCPRAVLVRPLGYRTTVSSSPSPPKARAGTASLCPRFSSCPPPGRVLCRRPPLALTFEGPVPRPVCGRGGTCAEGPNQTGCWEETGSVAVVTWVLPNLRRAAALQGRGETVLPPVTWEATSRSAPGHVTDWPETRPQSSPNSRG